MPPTEPPYATASGSCESAVLGPGESGARRPPARRDAEATKAAILRAYLKRWKAEVGVFFGGVGAESSEDELLRIAPDHPVFKLEA